MSRSIYAPTPEIRRINTVVPINKGGTNASDGPTAVSNLGGISVSEINAINGVAGTDNSGKLVSNVFPPLSNLDVGLSGSKTVIGGTLNTYQITNYDSNLTYTVSVDQGTIELFNDTIKLRTPNITGTITMTINGDNFPITVTDNYISKPTILAPTNYSNNVPAYVSIIGDKLNTSNTILLDEKVSNNSVGANYSFDQAVSLNDNVLVVTSPIDINSANQPNGLAYIYNNVNGIYQLVTTIDSGSNQTNQEWFGHNVEINDAGDRIFITAHLSNSTVGTSTGNLYIFNLINGTWTLTDTILPADVLANEQFGHGLAINNLGTRVFCSSYSKNNFSGKIYIYDLINGVWTLTGQIDGDVNSRLGYDLTCSEDGSILASGEHAYNSFTGKLRIFRDVSGTWVEDTVNDPVIPSGSQYGISCKLSYDNTFIVVSSKQEISNSGAAYILKYDTATSSWNSIKRLQSDTPVSGEDFGWRIEISYDNKNIIIGSRFGDAGKGLLYIFRDINIDWIITDKIHNPKTNGVSDEFGWYSCLSKSNKYLFVASRLNDDKFTDGGKLYIFQPTFHQSSSWELATDPNFTNIVQSAFNDTTNLTSWNVYDLLPATNYYARVKYTGTLFGSSDWSEPTEFTTEQQFLPDVEVNKLLASDGAAGDQYSAGVSVSGDGQWMAVGAIFNDNAQGTDAGKVYIYQRSGNSWTEVSTITEPFKLLGIRLSFNEDGSKLVVGSNTFTYSSTYGHAKVFTYTLVNGIPTKVNEFIPETTDTTPYYITRPTISKDGLVLAVGLNSYDTNGVVNAGIVYIYDWNATNNTWTYRTSVQESTPVANNYYGYSSSLNIDGSILTVSAVGDDTYGTDAGIVYVYDWNTTTSTYDLRTTVISNDIAAGDYFGSGLDISSDGSILVASAILKDTTAGIDAGKVYVYQWNSTTSTFDELYTLEASVAASNDQFGIDVSITTNKDLLVAGSRLDDNSNGVDAGAVYTFR